MIQNTQISNDITLSDEMIQFDTQAKNILSYACIEAWILKGVSKSFKTILCSESVQFSPGRN